jgi:hypothetical protein
MCFVAKCCAVNVGVRVGDGRKGEKIKETNRNKQETRKGK